MGNRRKYHDPIQVHGTQERSKNQFLHSIGMTDQMIIDLGADTAIKRSTEKNQGDMTLIKILKEQKLKLIRDAEEEVRIMDAFINHGIIAEQKKTDTEKEFSRRIREYRENGGKWSIDSEWQKRFTSELCSSLKIPFSTRKVILEFERQEQEDRQARA